MSVDFSAKAVSVNSSDIRKVTERVIISFLCEWMLGPDDVSGRSADRRGTDGPFLPKTPKKTSKKLFYSNIPNITNI